MKIFLAGATSRLWAVDTYMKIYLAGQAPYLSEGIYDEQIKGHKPYVLESYFYRTKDSEKYIPQYGDYLLDSGAFTFLHHADKTVQWEEYVEEYADFIKRNGVKKYFELDIDSVIGYDNVIRLRKRLEQITGLPCIPVWHTSRGIEEFKRMCDEYDYVSIGGIAGANKKGKIYQEYHKIFPWLIQQEHRRGGENTRTWLHTANTATQMPL